MFFIFAGKLFLTSVLNILINQLELNWDGDLSPTTIRKKERTSSLI